MPDHIGLGKSVSKGFGTCGEITKIMIVEISTHGSSLKRDHDCFIIQNINEKTEIPAEKIDAINITANVLISTQAIRLCIEKNIQLVISDYYGRPFSRLWVIHLVDLLNLEENNISIKILILL